jgi:hypothetical protein
MKKMKKIIIVFLSYLISTFIFFVCLPFVLVGMLSGFVLLLIGLGFTLTKNLFEIVGEMIKEESKMKRIKIGSQKDAKNVVYMRKRGTDGK